MQSVPSASWRKGTANSRGCGTRSPGIMRKWVIVIELGASSEIDQDWQLRETERERGRGRRERKGRVREREERERGKGERERGKGECVCEREQGETKVR
eukprot:1331005-Amorphochlora_amoeboformis.AAC.1